MGERRGSAVLFDGAGEGGPTIGTNKRYAHRYDQMMDDRILQGIAVEHQLQTLTPAELQTEALPVTRDPQPKRCTAWVRFGPHAAQVEAVVVVWNDVACGIQFQLGDQQMRCWVWSNAVTPLG